MTVERRTLEPTRLRRHEVKLEEFCFSVVHDLIDASCAFNQLWILGNSGFFHQNDITNVEILCK